MLEWKPPHAKWFIGGKLNVSVNCVDRHARGARRNKTAIIWEGEPGDRRTLTYYDLLREVGTCANVLKALGVERGDRVAMFMPLIPELAIAMLACARIGAVHSVVFGGFSAESLRNRINDAEARLLITADGSYRRGQIVPLKQIVDEALTDTPSIEHVVVVQRADGSSGGSNPTVASIPAHMKEGRDHWYHELQQDVPTRCAPESMDAEDVLYCTSCIHRAPPESRRASYIRRLDIWSVRTPRPSSYSTCGTTTSTGAQRISGGWKDTATWCTVRWRMALPCSCMKGLLTGRSETAFGPWLSTTSGFSDGLTMSSMWRVIGSERWRWRALSSTIRASPKPLSSAERTRSRVRRSRYSSR